MIDDRSVAIDAWRASPANEVLLRTFSDPDFDDGDWQPIKVPSHWQTEPSLSSVDGTVLYRADLTVPELRAGARRWLRFNGICYTGDAFLDGAYLGETEGYFTTHRFEITDLASTAGRYVLAMEVGAPRNGPITEPQRSLTGWFTHAPGADPAWNPAGIWRPVELVDTGPVAIRHFRVSCIEADPSRAVVALRAVLLAAEPGEVTLTTEVAGQVEVTNHVVASGENRVEWQIVVPEPELWWPTGYGDQPLFQLALTARTADGEVTDVKQRRIGFRSSAMRDFILRINSHRVFMRGINVAPLRQDLAGMTAAEIRAEVEAIRDAGFNLARVRAHVGRPEFLSACDELGVLVWQDLPLAGSYSRSVGDVAQQQARQLVDLASHHPSIVVWGAHTQPDGEPRTSAAPEIHRHQLPNWNRTVLDRKLLNTFENDDPSRPVVAHSDVPPHLPGLSGSDIGLFFGWHEGQAEDLAEYGAALPRLVRFVSDLGAQALPNNLDDLDAILGVLGAEPAALHRTTPADDYEDPASWAEQTRRYQADVIKTSIEILRVLKYNPTGGFCAGLWRSPRPGLTRALIDSDGTPRPALKAAQIALAPIQAMLYPPQNTVAARTSAEFSLYICNDTTDDVEVEVTALIADQRGERQRRWSGLSAADSVNFIGDLSARAGRIGDSLNIELALSSRGQQIATNSYTCTAL